MKTEVFAEGDKAAFLAALNGKKRKRAKAARPDLPRAAAGEGDRVAQLIRIAAYGYGPRFDAGIGHSFWNPQTGARTAACASYAEACIAAERELRAR